MSERNLGGPEEKLSKNELPKVGEPHTWSDPEYALIEGWSDQDGNLTDKGMEELAFRNEQLQRQQQRHLARRLEAAEGPVKKLDQDKRGKKKPVFSEEKTIKDIIVKRAKELDEKPFQRIRHLLVDELGNASGIIKRFERDGTSQKFKLTLAIGKDGYETWTGTAEELDKRIRKNFEKKPEKKP